MWECLTERGQNPEGQPGEVQLQQGLGLWSEGFWVLKAPPLKLRPRPQASNRSEPGTESLLGKP